MTAAPLATAPTVETTSRHQDVLNRFIDFGDRLVQLAVEQAEATTLPVEKAAASYDRVTRSVRKSIWLVRKLSEPPKDRTAARKRIIRTVEDAIQCHAEPSDAESLQEELLDRLDAPDLDDDIDNRPVADIITDIIRDLGLAHIPGTHPWKRRTPPELAELNARAAQLVDGLVRPPHQPVGPTHQYGWSNDQTVPADHQPGWPNHHPIGCNSS